MNDLLDVPDKPVERHYLIRGRDGRITGIERPAPAAPPQPDDAPVALLTMGLELADARYREGYKAGSTAGAQSGAAAGFKMAQQRGHDDAMMAGLAAGLRVGYQAGFQHGRGWEATYPGEPGPTVQINLERDADGTIRPQIEMTAPAAAAEKNGKRKRGK